MARLLTSGQHVTLAHLLVQAPVNTVAYSSIEGRAADQVLVDGIASLTNAQASDVTFITNPKYFAQAHKTQAGVVLLTPKHWENLNEQQLISNDITWVVCADPYLLYSKVAQWFVAQRPLKSPVIHASCVIDPSAVIGKNVDIAPFVVIGANSVIGDGTRIGAHTVIGDNVKIGIDSIIYPNVTLYNQVTAGDRFIIHSGSVIGADGFGFAPNRGNPSEAWSKIPQVGGVVIGNDVEIGANTSIDCGTLEPTRIGHGVKIDNQIQIGHNTQIGDFTALAGCCGIAGSAIIGKHCTFGGNAMIGGHLTIADGVHVSGGTVVISSIETPGVYTGIYPVGDHKQWERNAATLRQLSQLRKRIIALESNINNS